jgi:hypothetical protein
LIVLAAAAASGGENDQPSRREHIYWRSLAHQLPKAYRFLDRLDLTAEQEKALSKVYQDWQAQRREAYRKVHADFPRLKGKDLKDPETVKVYYLERSEALKAAQVAPPVALVDDILSEEQLVRLGEANKVIDSWEQWLSEYMTAHEKKLDALLGPPPEEPDRRRAYTFRVFARMVPGGSELGRLNLSDDQYERLDALRKSYYAETRDALAPLTQGARNGAVSYRQLATIRRAVTERARGLVNETYRERIFNILSNKQRAKLERAAKLIAERDRAIWDRYAMYLEELAAILPRQPLSPPPAEPESGASERPKE